MNEKNGTKIGLIEHLYLKYLRPSPEDEQINKKRKDYKVSKPVEDKVSLTEHIYLKYFRPPPPSDRQGTGCFAAILGLLHIGRK